VPSRRRTEDEAPEVGLVADPEEDGEDGVPEGFTVGDEEDLEDALDEDDEELEDEDEADGLEEGLDEADLADVDAVLAGAIAAPAVVEAPTTDSAAAVVLPADDDEDAIEGIRDDIEFVCTRCRLVKRTSQLAKGSRKKEPVCRSCA
jgi:hypothetical protein